MAHSQTAEAEREHFGWADGLRGLAALAILVFEVLKHAPNLHWVSPIVQRLALSSVHGFDALLVLSGLLLAYPVLRTLRREGSASFDLASFGFGRALRILPVYYLVLAATVLVPLGAANYGIRGLGHAAPAGAAGLQALFAGNGLDNDGFRALAVQVRLLALLPLLLAVFAFAPAVFAALGAFALYLDYATPSHHWGAGAVPTLMLGIVAADLIARGARVERFAWPLAAGSAALAFTLDPFLAGLPGPVADPSFLVWNPLWALAAASLAVACAARPGADRLLGARPFRRLAGVWYGLVLVAGPICAFALDHAAAGSSPWLPLSAAGLSLAAAFGLWQLTDRALTSNRANALVRTLAEPFAGAARLTLGAPRRGECVRSTAPAEVANVYGPLPTMHPGMLATVAKRVGSFEDLQAEIENVKRRLAEAATETLTFYEPAESFALESSPPDTPLEGVLLPPALPAPRKIVTLALGANRPPRPIVRVRFGPTLEGARAS